MKTQEERLVVLFSLFMACLMLLPVNVSPGNAGGYADMSYLVETEWLKDQIGRPDLLILDARPESAYGRGHIPGAINVGWKSFANMQGKPGDPGWGVILDPVKLSEAFAKIGVNETKTIVVYADPKNGWGEEGRFVWMLRVAGLNNSKLVNGGFPLWKSKDFPVSQEKGTTKTEQFRIAQFQRDWIADTAEVSSKLLTAKIVDNRSDAEYKGAVKYGEARGGHLPGAVLIPYLDFFADDGTLKSQNDLEQMMKTREISKNDEIITYCTAGIRSAYGAVVLRMAGYSRAKNYDGSFYRWAADKSLKIE